MANGFKTGGRTAGTPNRRTLEVEEKLQALDCDPIEGMARLALDDANTPELRGRMFAELAAYRYPKRKALQIEDVTPRRDPREMTDEELMAAIEAGRAGNPVAGKAKGTAVPSEPKATYDPGTLDLFAVTAELEKKYLEDEIKRLGPKAAETAVLDRESLTSKKLMARLKAEAFRKPEVQGAFIQSRIGANSMEGMELNWLISQLEASTAKVVAGDLSEIERTLMSQASALSAAFTSLMIRGTGQIGNDIPRMDTYFRLALKAQSQCRTTLETLAEIKNPRQVAFVRQANIANGPQQVNNGEVPARGESSSPPNKVLEHQHEERVEFGAASQAVSRDPEMATVGEVLRSEDR